MGFRILTEQMDLLRYIEFTEAHLGVRFPLEYLKNGKVVGFFDASGILSGGYALILKGPFRVLESLPNSVSLEHPMLRKMNDTSVCELTGFWLSPNITSKRTALRLWLKMYFHVIRLKKKYFVFAYSIEKKALGQLYSIIRPVVLFQGQTKLLPGMRKPEVESVELATWFNIFTAPLRNPHAILLKLSGKRKLSKNLKFMKMLHANLMNLK